MTFGWNVNFDSIIGKKILSVELDKSKDLVTFKFEGDVEKRYSVEGDCCSNSWIEHLEVPNDVAGATLTAVESTDKVRTPTPEEEAEHECLDVYGVSFQTTKGEIILEFRNSSNGYYGGYLVDVTPSGSA